MTGSLISSLPTIKKCSFIKSNLRNYAISLLLKLFLELLTGLLPIIRSLKLFGKDPEMVESVDEIRDHVFDRDQGEAAIEGKV